MDARVARGEVGPIGETRELGLPVASIFQGGYEILAELGAGTFGRVHKARQLSTGQEVAIKVLRFWPDARPADVDNQSERFRREMRLCSQLSHPNIVRLIDSGETGEGVLYAVFEFVPGSTLKQVLAEQGKLTLRETIHLMTQVLDALSCAHLRGVVHRDLKPENIMVTKTGARRNALVLDFGLGGLTGGAGALQLPRITMTSQIMGTPSYAAPEQLRGERASTRSDLYSWGLVFLECLTGELAVNGATVQEVIFKQLGPEPISIPSWLPHRVGKLLETVTAKQIEKRDVTIEGLLEALAVMDADALETIPATGKPAALPQGERRQVTVVCCRLAVASLTDAGLDLEDVDQLLHAQLAVLAEYAGRGGGHVAGVLADRVMLVFGYPQAREDDARRAARAALEIAAHVDRANARLESERGLHLDVRLGVHTGLVIARELRHASRQSLHDLVGLTPQLAIRLQEQAGPAEVLVSLDTRRLLRNEIACEPAGELPAGECGAAMPVYRLIAGRGSIGLETISSARETPFVGRAPDLNLLLERWAQVQEGRAGAVLIRGEPGIGKSRLVRELRRRVPADAWVECRCIPENQNTPLRPVADMLMAIGEPVESVLRRYDFDLPENLPLFMALLSMPPNDQYTLLQLSPERQKQLTLNALQALLLKMTERRPLVLAIEDLHWADPTTLELIARLLEEVRSAQVLDGEPGPRLYAVFTARTEFTPTFPLDDLLLIQLSRLGRHDVEQIVTEGFASLPPAMLDEVIRRADGVPLFVEELARVLVDARAAGDASGDRSGTVHIGIPGTLRDLLGARLDRLGSRVRETAQLAAVLGREFRYEVLSAVAAKDESALREDLHELTATGLVYHRQTARDESYVFKHALVREAAYETMLKATRQATHARVANVLQQRFPDLEQHRPEILAHHFELGGQLEDAVEYWHRAGERAMRRAGYVEAINQLEKALALMEGLPKSQDRLRQEVALLEALGTALFSTKGFAAEEVQRIFSRARERCEGLFEDLPVKVLNGLWVVSFTRSDREGAAALIPRFRRLAEYADDPVGLMAGHATLAAYAFARGDFAAAREHAVRGKQCYWTPEFQRFAREYGYDGGLFCYSNEMFSLWNLGYPDQAEAIRQELASIAEKSGHPFSLSIALGDGASLANSRGEHAAALEWTDRLAEVATQQHYYVWLAASMCLRGGALAGRGAPEEGIAQIQQGLNLYRMIGVLYAYSYFLTYLAAACRDAGRLDEGLAAVDEGLAQCETLLIRLHESQLLSLKGELLRRQGDVQAAEAHLRRAMEVAERDQALSIELRAATALSRLLRDQGSRDAARSVLTGVFGRFTEGFETKDLRAAKELLAELA